MHDLYTLRDMLVKELEGFGRKGDLNRQNLDTIDKLAHAAKNVSKVIDYCKNDEFNNSLIKNLSEDDSHFNAMKEQMREELRKMVEAF